jgi:hypothetical protein
LRQQNFAPILHHAAIYVTLVAYFYCGDNCMQSSNTGAGVVESFRQAVIERFQVTIDGRVCGYREYLSKPEALRSGDEANAVDQQFTRCVLEWLGFRPAEWDYNQPVAGKKANRPDYRIKATIGTAFIWEDKNSTLDLDDEHIVQMRRYCRGTAGYAVWCNMRRIWAIRFLPSAGIKYELLTDVAVEELFGLQQPLAFTQEKQSTNLALLQLLFGKERFTQFSALVAGIAIDEETFERQAISLDQPEATRGFIDGSRQSLEHLRLAALLQIREALEKHETLARRAVFLRAEWGRTRDELISALGFTAAAFDAISKPVFDAIEQLTPRVGNLNVEEIRGVATVCERTVSKTVGRVTASLRTKLEKWLEQALRINSALLSQRFNAAESYRIADAYQVWSERQSDKEDVRPEVFAEQVAYVFFVRLLLVRVLEDKHILRPRLASDGGFLDWSSYIQRHFRELDGISVLNQNFASILALKASQYYLHFFHQVIFDWFQPDDFLLVETLEFLCRYNFQTVTSDIIGFTYEEYIDRNARNRKGHFLTRHEVVEYMLDLLDYNGPQVVGRRMLDPACGSGSFLVHAARRYRRALVAYFCNQEGLPDSEESIDTHPELQKELALRYIEDITSLFFGMELNPFACYLAEMNLLIQALDDLYVLEQAGELLTIDRFHIYNTNSLGLPYEVLDSEDVSGTTKVVVPDRLSDRLTDEAFAIKARKDAYAEGFFYIISNPPYVSSKQEEFDTRRYRDVNFYRAILSGDTNLYLLFLRVGLYYLADYGQMIYIVPLTIFGDKSASAARKLLQTPPFAPSVAVRFYRGDILFPGVDQAVSMVRVNRLQSVTTMLVSGGNTIQEARANQFHVPAADVVAATPHNPIWQGSWLVAQDRSSWDIWRHVQQVSGDLTTQLETLLDTVFDRKQGDVNATYLNPLRLGAGEGSFANGDVAIYKGEDVKAYAPVPSSPSDWARPLMDNGKTEPRETLRASEILEQLRHITGQERGIVLREVARLNTRERLIATWFERSADQPVAFTHVLWRMTLKEEANEEDGKALLAFMNSDVAAYLVNLFSTVNHVSKDDLGRVPIPDPQTMPVARLAQLANDLLRERARLEQYMQQYGTILPERDASSVYIPPSAYLKSVTLPKLTMAALVGRGEVKNYGAAGGRIKALRAKNMIVSTVDPARSHAQAFAQTLALFLEERGRGDETWSQALRWQLPDTVAAAAWLDGYNAACQTVQTSWDTFVAWQQQVDDVVADWYGFDSMLRRAIANGLPWARRQRADLP